MKYISRILFTVGLVFGLSACTEDAIDNIGPKLPDNGDMSVNLTFAMPDAVAQTRSKVSGTENNVSTMQMVCFDANGLYLGIRNAVVTSDNATPDTGKIKGTVPQGTSRIHFIANRNLTIPLTANVGTPESEVMHSEELSTIWNDADHHEVCYWGYHKEENATLMDAWLNPEGASGTVQDSKVYLIRDRAKVVLTYDPTDASVPVTKIEWLIHNGRERGYLAPAETSWSNTGYYANSTVEGHTDELISVAGMNEYTAGGRYSLWTSETENDEGNFDETYNTTDGNKKVAQFLFDDDNEEIDGLKAILRVTYMVDDTPTTVYHVLKLNRVVDEVNNVRELYDIVRTNTYYINAKLLSPDVAYYETLLDAINGTEFMNAEMEVDRTITEVNNKQYTLQILLPSETTSIVLNTEGEHNEMHFAFRLAADVSTTGSTNPADFEVKWEKSQTFCSDPELTYKESTKQFEISTTVLEGKLTQNLQDEWIVVKHKATGLTRFIHVFVIDQFRYKLYPKLTRVGTGNYGDCLLTFTLPPMEHTQFLPDGSPDPNELVYPHSLYPIEVKFTTNTLNAYGTTQGTTNYGLFGVAVESTSGLVTTESFEDGYNSPVSSTDYNADRTHWYYQQGGNFWDFWYTYSLKTYPENGIVNIYFKDVRQNIQYATVADVGLFLYVEYFGKNYSIPLSTN